MRVCKLASAHAHPLSAAGLTGAKPLSIEKLARHVNRAKK
jgi:hypothetical protein